MSDNHEVVTGRHVITCVVCGRTERSALYGRGEMFAAQREHERQRYAEGWRLWISRSRRWYCPEHAPKPGHNMYQVVPR